MDCDDWHCAQNPPTPSVGRRTHNLRLCFRKRLDDSLHRGGTVARRIGGGTTASRGTDARRTANRKTVDGGTAVRETANRESNCAGACGRRCADGLLGHFSRSCAQRPPQRTPVEIIIAVPHAGLHVSPPSVLTRLAEDEVIAASTAPRCCGDVGVVMAPVDPHGQPLSIVCKTRTMIAAIMALAVTATTNKPV